MYLNPNNTSQQTYRKMDKRIHILLLMSDERICKL